MPLIFSLMSLPRAYISPKLLPNTLIAMLACVPESMASIRCVIGAPTSTAMPGTAASFSRTSASTSSLSRPASSKGASISDVFTPSACSSSSARPVLRPTVFISGTESNRRSTLWPILSDSSKDMPGSVVTLMVNEPSLNGGKNPLPMVQNRAMAATKAQAVVASTAFFLPITHCRAFI